MKYAIIVSLAVLHILFLVVTGISHTITAYFDFYSVNKTVGAAKHIHNVNRKVQAVSMFVPVGIYAKYSGAETGYGFFAPNVLSSGDINFTSKGKGLRPQFRSYESAIRYTAMISKIMSHYINPPSDTTSSGEIKGKRFTYKNAAELEDKYYELVYKNIATKIYADYSCEDTLRVRLQIYDYPSLKDYRAGTHTIGKFITLKENKIFNQN